MSVRDDPEQRLRDRVRREADALAEQALRAGGQVEKQDLERLANLAQLADMVGARRSARARPWAPAIALAATLLIVSMLLFARVSETEIELEATVSEASFRIGSAQWLTDRLKLSTLGASGLAGVRWPAGLALVNDASAGAALQPLAALRIEVALPPAAASASASTAAGAVTLPSIHLGADSLVQVRRSAGAAGVALTLAAPASALNPNLLGMIVVEAAGIAPGPHRIALPTSLSLMPGPGDLDLDLQPASAVVFATPLSIRGLGLERIDVAQGGAQSLVRRLSTVVSGQVRLVSLNSEVRVLRRGESLRFDAVHGVLRGLAADGPALTLAFSGRVRGMRAGSDDNPHDLMPTWLEWLGARHGLTLFWGTSLYLFGLSMAVWRWWSGRP